MSGFVDRLKSVLANRTVSEYGQLQWLSLDMVRCKAGDDWIRIAKTVYDVSARFIETKLGAEDAVIQARGGFIIIFAEPDSAAAMARVASVSEELNTFFQDDQVLSMLGVSATAEPVSPARLLDRIAATAARENAPGDARFGAGEALDSGDEWRPLDFAEVDPSKARSLRRAGSAGGGKSAGSASRGDRTDALAFDPANKGDSVIFKPSWDAYNERISTYFCLARRNWHGQALYGRQVLMSGGDGERHCALDLIVARAAAEAVLNQIEAGDRSGVVIPTHFAAISTPGLRQDFLDALKDVPHKARTRLYVQIDDLPGRAPTSLLDEIIGDIHAFGSSVLVKTEFGASDLHHFDRLGVDLFGAAATLKASRDGLTAAEAEALGEWSDWAQRLRAATYLTQADSVELVESAARAGVRYFVGDAVGGDCEAPQAAGEKPLSELRRAAGAG